MVGCKVTLRRKNLNNFFETLSLGLPRMEKFKGISILTLRKSEKAMLSLKLTEIVFFFQMELGLGINTDVKSLEIQFLFNILTLEEKIFLIMSKRLPIES
jgi:ribosomal protein L5